MRCTELGRTSASTQNNKSSHAEKVKSKPMTISTTGTTTIPATGATVHRVPAFNDNYIWLLDNGDGTAMAVDPGDAAPIEAALAAKGLRLDAILLTHHHFDHVGGVERLKAAWQCTVYGPRNPAIAHIDTRLNAGDQFRRGAYAFRVMAVPGHTLDHIAYFQAGPEPLLFCGDTLFAGGCGRIFEGDPPMMYKSLTSLASLPEETAVYCAHEYTLANLAFAMVAEPENELLRQREADTRTLRSEGKATVPSSLKLELDTNPFLRSSRESLRVGLRAAGRDPGNTPLDTFAQLRQWKDDF
ncbi:MAG: hydroxyacylglutathione hydrolase [Halieaceae bacterium]